MTSRLKNNHHGAVKAVMTHFEYEDGTIYYPFGTTVYALVHQPDELWNTTMTTLEKSPFNKVRFCVFPKYYSWNDTGPPYYPFEGEIGNWDVRRPNPKFWERLEKTLCRLEKAEIQADLILFHPYDKWGFSRLSREDALFYLEYTVITLGHHKNIWWSLANEYDLIDYSQEDWECFASCIHEIDSGRHLISNHNAIHFWDFSNKDTTHICLQTEDIVHATGLLRKFGKPVIIDECGYEGNLEFNWGNLSAQDMVERVWTAVARGAYCTHGETFLQGIEREILWWSHGGTLRGESWKRIGFLRGILENLSVPLSFLDRSYVSYTQEELDKIRKMPSGMRPKEFSHGQYLKGLLSATEDEASRLQELLSPHCAAFEEEVFLYYFGRRCPGSFTPILPQGREYVVSIIDTWNMTVETIPCPKTIKLPGRSYMAILICARAFQKRMENEKR